MATGWDAQTDEDRGMVSAKKIPGRGGFTEMGKLRWEVWLGRVEDTGPTSRPGGVF